MTQNFTFKRKESKDQLSRGRFVQNLQDTVKRYRNRSKTLEPQISAQDMEIEQRNETLDSQNDLQVPLNNIDQRQDSFSSFLSIPDLGSSNELQQIEDSDHDIPTAQPQVDEQTEEQIKTRYPTFRLPSLKKADNSLFSSILIVMVASSYAHVIFDVTIPPFMKIGYIEVISKFLQYDLYCFILQVIIVYAIFLKLLKNFCDALGSKSQNRDFFMSGGENNTRELYTNEGLYKGDEKEEKIYPWIVRVSWKPTWSNIIELLIYLVSVQAQRQHCLIYSYSLHFSQAIIQISLFVMVYQLERFIENVQYESAYRKNLAYSHLGAFQDMQTTYVQIIQCIVLFIINNVIQWFKIYDEDGVYNGTYLQYVTTVFNSIGAAGALLATCLYKYLLSKIYLEGDMSQHFKRRYLKKPVARRPLAIVRNISYVFIALLSLFLVIYFILNMIQQGWSMQRYDKIFSQCKLDFKTSNNFMDSFYQVQRGNAIDKRQDISKYLSQLNPSQDTFHNPNLFQAPVYNNSYNLSYVVVNKCKNKDDPFQQGVDCRNLIVPQIFLNTSKGPQVVYQSENTTIQMHMFTDRRNRVFLNSLSAGCEGEVSWFQDEYAVKFNKKSKYMCQSHDNSTVIVDQSTLFVPVTKQDEFQIRLTTAKNHTLPDIYYLFETQIYNQLPGEQYENRVFINIHEDSPQFILGNDLYSMVRDGFRVRTMVCLGKDCWKYNKQIYDTMGETIQNVAKANQTYAVYLQQNNVTDGRQTQEMNIIQIQYSGQNITRMTNANIDTNQKSEIYVNQEDYFTYHKQLQECMYEQYRVSFEMGIYVVLGRQFYSIIQLLYCGFLFIFGVARLLIQTQESKIVQYQGYSFSQSDVQSRSLKSKNTKKSTKSYGDGTVQMRDFVDTKASEPTSQVGLFSTDMQKV